MVETNLQRASGAAASSAVAICRKLCMCGFAVHVYSKHAANAYTVWRRLLLLCKACR